ncbi:amino acid ABC transporter substrate-binding protein [Alkalimonas mucilaginosa]|uniref:Amino acid ABC transporter substrate-binding protein n=1 Tax=Alkalimonas mucilaginosa TaxID=3057676 RepID=A0ABU7JGT6_9GAMM|nr:amino acid ABC transporter substrate-binding protein [Alkalimonas sp. MEB004]MEE2024233.1 amino acid ABC transporter substrate-binding protein [Alkalimonas sp. MEB004]
MMRIIWSTVLFSLIFPLQAMTTIVYPAAESEQDIRFADVMEILQLALELTKPEYGPFELQPFPVQLTESRSRALLKQTQELDLLWSPTSLQLEDELLPVRIPLRKGLLSYRLCLVNKQQQQRLQSISNLAELRQLVIGQGAGWLDTEVYRYNGLRVVTGPYDDLFAMLARDRFDIFPRGLAEAFAELEVRQSTFPNLTIDEELLLYYPWPYYFFVHPSNQELAERLELGMRRMIANGSFDDIFYRYNHTAIERANLPGRRLIRLENPHLPASAPVADPELWFTPDTWR